MSVDDVTMNILGGAVGGVLRALEAQEAQRTARELAVARENRKGSRLTVEEFVECANDAVGLCEAVTLTLHNREIEKMKAAYPDPPDGASAMSQEEIDALLKSTLEDAGKPS